MARARGLIRQGFLGRGDDRAGVAVAGPCCDVDRGPGFSRRRLAVPHGELANRSIEESRSQQCEAHRQFRPVSIEHVVAQIRVVCRETDRGRSIHAPPETRHPFTPTIGDGALHELLGREGQYHVELSTDGQERLGPHDVRAAREGAVREPGGIRRDLDLDAVADLRLGRRRKPSARARWRDAVPAEMDDGRPRDLREDVRVDPRCLTDEPELPPGGRQSAVVLFVARRCAREGRARSILAPQHQRRLGLRRRDVVRSRILGAQRVEHKPGQPASLVRLSREKRQRCGVDPRVVAAGRLEDGQVARRRVRRLAPPLRPIGRQSDVLRDARPQSLHILREDRSEPVALESPKGLVRGSGARESEDGPVSQPHIVRMFGQSTFRQIER